jgi:hypothetical protein
MGRQLERSHLSQSKKKRETGAHLDGCQHGLWYDIGIFQHGFHVLQKVPKPAISIPIKKQWMATRINNDYFMKTRTGACKFLNVLQGENFQQADDWYQQMKDYCDPKKYPTTHFNGWAMGGQNMCDVHLILKRLVALRFDGLLEKAFMIGCTF